MGEHGSEVKMSHDVMMTLLQGPELLVLRCIIPSAVKIKLA